MMTAFAPKYKPEGHWFVKSGTKTILDVGSHMREFAQRIRAILPDADLVCFEPVRKPFLALSQRFAGQSTSSYFSAHLVGRRGNVKFIATNMPQVHLCR
jgi:hypothetical protein